MSGAFLIAIPMKDPGAAKTRLAPALSAQERRELALGLFRRTLDVIGEADCGADVLVVTESEEIEALCAARGVLALKEGAPEGLNAACARAAGWAREREFPRMAILPADLALLTGADIARLAALSLKRREIALCEASDGGTNCLLFRPEDEIEFLYGPGSFSAYRRAAMREGMVCHVIRGSDMRFDIDTSEDLAALGERGSGLGRRA